MTLEDRINSYCKATNADPNSTMSFLTEEEKKAWELHKERIEFANFIHRNGGPLKVGIDVLVEGKDYQVIDDK